METQRIKKVVLKKIKDRKASENYVGDILRRARLHQNLTQEALSEHQSNTYYSKVENNKIQPNEFFVREISDKLGINLVEIMPGKARDELYALVIKYFYYKDINGLKTISNKLKSPSQATQLDIILSCIYLISNDLKSLKHHVDQLESLVNALDELQMQFFLILAGIYAYKTCDYKTAVESFNILELYNNLPPLLKAIQNHYTFLSHQKLKLQNISINHYMDALIAHKNNRQIVMQDELELYKLYFALTEYPKALKKEINQLDSYKISQDYKTMFYYLKIHYDIAQDTLSEVSTLITELMSLNVYDKWYYKAILLVYMHENRLNLFLDYDAIFSPILDNERYCCEVAVYRYLNGVNDEEKRGYLKDYAIPLVMKHQALDLLSFFQRELTHLLSKNARYKEIYALNNKVDKYLVKLKTIN